MTDYIVKNKNRLIAFLLVFSLISSLFLGFPTTALAAGAVVGSSGAYSSNATPGGGISHINKPIYRVWVAREPAVYNDGSADAQAKMLDTFGHRYPAPDTTTVMHFIPGGIDNGGYTIKPQFYDNKRVAVGAYNAGSKTLDVVSTGDVVDTLRYLSIVSGSVDNVYGSDMSNYGFNTTGGKQPFTELLNGDKWKTIVANKPFDQSLNAWAYFFQNENDTYDVHNRILQFLGPKADLDLTTLTKSEQEEIVRGYLDLLFTLYRIAPASELVSYEQTIKDYITGATMEAKPVALVIDTAVSMNTPNGDYADQIVLPTMDYILFNTGTESLYNLYQNSNVVTDSAYVGNSYGMILDVVKRSMGASPDFMRITDTYNNSNPFSRAFSAALYPSNRLVTYPYDGPYFVPSSVTDAILETLNFGSTSNGNIYGFLIIGASIQGPDLHANITATPDDGLVSIDPYSVDVESEICVAGVGLDIRAIEDDAVISKWGSKLDLPGNDTVTVKLALTRNPSGATLVSSEGDFATGIVMSKDRFKAFLNGTQHIILTDTATINEPISAGTSKMFSYTGNLDVTYKEGGSSRTVSVPLSPTNPEILLGGLEGATFTRGVPPPISYISQPQAYSELKSGNPLDASANEEFEVMAGVPSTEQVYFAVGGSEFIVDIGIDYRQDVQGKARTYDSYFTGGVDCEFKSGDTAVMGGQTHSFTETRDQTSGSVSGHSAPPPPAAKPKTYEWTGDSDGIKRTITESYTLNSSVSTAHDMKTGKNTDGSTYQYDAGPCTTTYSYSYTYTVSAHAICGPCCEHVLPEVHDTWKQDVKFDTLEIIKAHVWKIDQGNIGSSTDSTGASNGIKVLIGATDIHATIKQGDPNIFYNMANQGYSTPDTLNAESSLEGRLRYSLEPQQHDTVVWNEGARTNNCNGEGNTENRGGDGHSEVWADGILYDNRTFPLDDPNYDNPTGNNTNPSAKADSKDAATSEYAKFQQRRNSTNVATMISDFLILQTSSGDQSVLYFQKDSTPKKAEEKFDKIVATRDEMWKNNPKSAANWSKTQINIGSYNGKYSQPTAKYLGTGTNSVVQTKFDPDPAGTISRPARPSQLFIYKDKQQLIPTLPNKAYPTGNGKVFWEHILGYGEKGSYNNQIQADSSTVYDYTNKTGVWGNKPGMVMSAPYYNSYTKTNDLIIHTPVSVEDAVVEALDPSRDQRSIRPLGGADDLIDNKNKLEVCPLDPALCEFRVLDCQYFQDKLLADFDFEPFVNDDGSTNTTQAKDKVTGKKFTLPSGFTMSNATPLGTSKSLSAFGTRWSIPFSDIGISNDLRHNLFEISGDFYIPTLSNGGGTMLVSFYGYDFYIPLNSVKATWNTGEGMERVANYAILNKKLHLDMQFSFGSIEDSKLFIDGVEFTDYTRVNPSKAFDKDLIGSSLIIGSWGRTDNYPAQFYIDNLQISRKAGSATHTDACYKTIDVHQTYTVNTWLNGVASTETTTNNKHVHTAECLTYGLAKVIPASTVTEGTPQNFAYTGNVQTYTVPATGTYKLETWGAEGGWGCITATGYDSPDPGGKGGYSKATFSLIKGQTLYIYAGGKGSNSSPPWGDGNLIAEDYMVAGGWNGGGTGYIGGGGGGATDIRLSGQTLADRIIVAGGGGGADVNNTSNYGGNGGGANQNGTTGYASVAGGTLTSGYLLGLGKGATDSNAGGGGGGYWGGLADSSKESGGGGGSGYANTTLGTDISGTTGTNLGNGKVSITPMSITPEALGGEVGIAYLDSLLKANPIDWQKIRDTLGSTAFDQVFGANSLISSWTWTTAGDTKGFTPLNNSTVVQSSNQLAFTATGADPFAEVPVDLKTSGVTHIKIYFNNQSTGTYGQMFYKGSMGSYSGTNSISYNMTPNTTSQVATLDMTTKSSWSGDVSSLRFDFTNASSGSVWISKIEFYGNGVLQNSGSSNGTTFDYAYTGGSQTLVASGGKYTLEVWGAQGGSDSNAGGKGGYSKGDITLSSGGRFYIFVGSKGGEQRGTTQDGGYNGGGYGYGYGGGGGGMTFISTSSNATVAPNNQSSTGGSWNDSGVVIVAGGGGGSGPQQGGYGGGTTGGTGNSGCGSAGTGGSQTAGGTGGSNNGTSGGHGYGGSNTSGSNSGGGGGGGGWYGGGGGGNDYSSYNDNDDSGAGGGSGYVGGVTNSSMQGDIREGDGYARITSLFSPLKIGAPSYDLNTIQTKVQNNFNTIPDNLSDGSPNPIWGCYNLLAVNSPSEGASSLGVFSTVNANEGSTGSKTFSYTGAYETFTASETGTYTLETWGAQGGSKGGGTGGKGGWSKGDIALNKGDVLYVYVGGIPIGSTGGWNGGGSHSDSGSAGGGATDIRKGGNALTNRIIVAGGGGGGGSGNSGETHNGGTGGGTTGGDGTRGKGGTQTAGGTGDYLGSLGQGAQGASHGTAGGGGYYGGGGGDSCSESGGGGSGYTTGLTATSASNGIQSGNGQAKITWSIPATSGTTTILNPATNTNVTALHLKKGANMPVIDSPTLELKANTEYLLEFDYWADADNIKFDVDLFPDNLPQAFPVADKTLKHYRFKFNSSSTNMTSAKIRFFNDVTVPNPANIYITNIRLHEGAYYNEHEDTASCTTTRILACNEPHHYGVHYDGSNPLCWRACGIDDNHKNYKPTVTTLNGEEIPNGDFINMDYPFKIYYPNVGDFYGSGALGLASLTTQRGKGYINNMNTTQWTKSKKVRFAFNVTFNGKLYLANEWIDLPIASAYDTLNYNGGSIQLPRQGTEYTEYEFYCVLANYEAKGAKVTYESTAINSPGPNDNKINPTNRERYAAYTSLHGAHLDSFIDVVGRIGNLVVMDTEDYRFSNFFKVSRVPTEWLVEGFVKKVDTGLQNNYYGDTVDIRGIPASTSTHWLNTYNTQDWKDKEPTKFPLESADNNIPQLQGQDMRYGYNMFTDISSIGNYYSGKLQVVPYYYSLNLTNGQWTPVDAYILTEGQYKPVNLFDYAKPGWDQSKIYPYVLNLDWVAESERRNYTMTEKFITDKIASIRKEYVSSFVNNEYVVTGEREMDRPVGMWYNLGISQFMILNGKARTFIGSSKTYGTEYNLGNRILTTNWNLMAQRWHFKIGVPSSTVFVPKGLDVNKETIDMVMNTDSAIIATADIQSIGDTYVLRYTQPQVNTIRVNGATFTIPSGTPPVFGVFSSSKSSSTDIDIQRTN